MEPHPTFAISQITRDIVASSGDHYVTPFMWQFWVVLGAFIALCVFVFLMLCGIFGVFDK